jgi:hypothetical protein
MARKSSSLDDRIDEEENKDEEEELSEIFRKNLYIPHGLPTEGNGDLRTHYSGIKSYDEDMEVAELMVQYSKHPDDELNKRQLVCFYVQKAYHYLKTVTNFYKELDREYESMYVKEEKEYKKSRIC